MLANLSIIPATQVLQLHVADATYDLRADQFAQSAALIDSFVRDAFVGELHSCIFPAPLPGGQWTTGTQVFFEMSSHLSDWLAEVEQK